MTPDDAAFKEVVDIARDTAVALTQMTELKRTEHAKLDTILVVQQAQTAALTAISTALSTLVGTSKENRDSAVREIISAVNARNGLVLLAAAIVGGCGLAASLLTLFVRH